MDDYISRDAAINAISQNTANCNPNDFNLQDKESYGQWMLNNGFNIGIAMAKVDIDQIPAVDVLPVPPGGIGEISDGYHTFNGLYYQRMVLFSALVNAYSDKSWKSWKHEDGSPCFGGGWFIASCVQKQYCIEGLAYVSLSINAGNDK